MEKDKASAGFELELKIRMPPKLFKWLLWLLAGGGALSAAASHWIN
ncbi:hypothetical protein IC235_11280 [Hymenobacter sp. BT664]|uniref:Uncharacterized protein n=1 Tax=Hymenobacter montanus TaxID=2771359 RepID=A0A927BCW0_9BACT|nr:hypothetical protein [Hymenobacter montanus]MBD2768472.1 hypothetical protein [Hymenobacter montanus]